MTDAIKKFFSSPSAVATIMVAVIGQVMLSTVWQIRNNEQQASQIAQNNRDQQRVAAQIAIMVDKEVTIDKRINDLRADTLAQITSQIQLSAQTIQQLNERQNRLLAAVETLLSERRKRDGTEQ